MFLARRAACAARTVDALSRFRAPTGCVNRRDLIKILLQPSPVDDQQNGQQPRSQYVAGFHSSHRVLADGAETRSSLVPAEEPKLDVSERFIPLTRRSLMRALLQEELMNQEEKNKFDKFSAQLDAAIVNRYHGILTELKTLFDPINPDKDTLQTREYNRKDRLDNEFWLLQKLASVMDRANFHEIPREMMEAALSEHQAREGVLVSVDPDRYDVLRFWALGRELPQQSWPWYKTLYYKLRKQSPRKPLEYYKRVVVASRLKRDQKLMLKMFKQVPVNALEQLLPDGKIKMTDMDKNIIKATVAIGSLGVLVKLLGFMVNQDIHWTLILSAASGLVALQSWTVYQNRKRSYLVDLTRMLYFKNIANNRGLLTLLVDRAEDESFKEALLVYTFLLCNRAPSTRAKESALQSPDELGAISSTLLEHQIENFILQKTNMTIDFNSTEALALLKAFGLVSESSENDGKFSVLPLVTAQRHLPQLPETILVRTESDVSDVEGFDRDSYLESEKELKREEVKSRKYGWF